MFILLAVSLCWQNPALAENFAEDSSIYKEAAKAQNLGEENWQLLSGIHAAETSGTRHTGSPISYAGARGCMQFMPATWEKYKVDGNGDGEIEITNCEDSVHSAANYLAKLHEKNNWWNTIWHYNHAQWYVKKVWRVALNLGWTF